MGKFVSSRVDIIVRVVVVKCRTYRKFPLKAFPNFVNSVLITLSKFDRFDNKLFGKTTIHRKENNAKGTRSKFAVGDAMPDILIGEFNRFMIFGAACHHLEKLGSIPS